MMDFTLSAELHPCWCFPFIETQLFWINAYYQFDIWLSQRNVQNSLLGIFPILKIWTHLELMSFQMRACRSKSHDSEKIIYWECGDYPRNEDLGTFQADYNKMVQRRYLLQLRLETTSLFILFIYFIFCKDWTNTCPFLKTWKQIK